MKNALQTIAKTPDHLVVGNHIITFDRPPVGDYFTKKTSLASSYTEVGKLFVGLAGADDDSVLGYVDWSTAKANDAGVFVQRVLNRRNRYLKFLEELIDAGMVTTASQPIQNRVKRGKNGEIIAWPVRRDSLVVPAAAQRSLSTGQRRAMKALDLALPRLKGCRRAMAAAEAELLMIDIEALPAHFRERDLALAAARAETLLIEIELI